METLPSILTIERRGTYLCQKVEAFLMLSLWCFSQRFGHDFALAEKKPAGTSPLSSDLLQAFVAHIANAEDPNVIILVDRLSQLGNQSGFRGLCGPNRRL